MAAASPIDAYLSRLHAEWLADGSGAVADYIPPLALADPGSFGIAIATTEGHHYEVGDSRRPFTIQSISKPFTYSAVASKIRDVLEIGRTGRVLAIVAEPTIRALAIEALVSAGKQVDEAANGLEGLSRIRSAEGRYDIVIIDEQLPDRQLAGLIEELRAIRADLPLLIAATDDARIEQAHADDSAITMLPRPFNATQLNAAVDARLKRS